MTTEPELREKLRKISALFEGAQTDGERDAAAAEINRVRAALDAAEKTEPAVELRYSLIDRLKRRLFVALCRRYGLSPYRNRRQRYSTVMLRAPASFQNGILWPELLEISRAHYAHLEEATEWIIREEVLGDAGEAGSEEICPRSRPSTLSFLRSNGLQLLRRSLRALLGCVEGDSGRRHPENSVGQSLQPDRGPSPPALSRSREVSGHRRGRGWLQARA